MNEKDINADFFYSPDTLDFIVKNNEYLEEYFKNSSKIKAYFPISNNRYFIGYIDRSDAEEVRTALGSSFLSARSLVMGLLDRESLESAGIIQVQEQPYLNLRGQGVVIGFVDTGIDYTLDVFKFEDGTSKIKSIYDQTARGTPPEGYFSGIEYTNEQINEALKADDPYSVVPQKDEVGHGTFLASVAAGREVGDFIGAAPDAELIVVKLKEARPYYREMYLIPPEQKNAYESSAVMAGIDYIMKKAQQYNRPVVICIALGTNQGGHDGYTLFEEYLSEISNIGGTCICNAAGNESQAKHHFQGILDKSGDGQNIDIKVGENAGDIYLSIWNSVSDRISVAIQSPTGEKISRIGAKSGTIFRTKLILEKAIVIIEYYFPTGGSGGQSTVVKILNATPGIWSVYVFGEIVLEGTFHAWLPVTGFVSPDVEILTPNPYYTVTVPSTAIGPIITGAYNSQNNSLYSNTSWGPTRLPMMSPDLVAPGVNVGGFYPGGYGTMDGTSVAAAITAGASALMLQWGVVEKNDPLISTYQIRAYLIRGCERDENILYPNNQWGYGKLDLFNTFNQLR